MKTEEVQKLAKMMRLEISDAEAERIGSDMDAVIHYIDQLQQVPLENTDVSRGVLTNIVRADVAMNETGIYTEQILAESPETQDTFVKVKKVL